MILTYKFRLRDKHAAELTRQARAINFVWNYCNEVQKKAIQAKRQRLTGYDFQRLTTGSHIMLDISAQSINRTCVQYAKSVRQNKKAWLKWRTRKSLGWIPFDGRNIRFDGRAFKFRGIRYEPMHLRGNLSANTKFSDGSFNQDSRGRWYVNFPVEVETSDRAPISRVGVDLGVTTIAALSDGEKIKAGCFYRTSEAQLAVVQRARKTRRTKAIHVKIANRRRDFLHKTSAKLAKEYGLIVIGNISPSGLAKTRLAKSVLDAGWADFKNMLSYKAIRHGGGTLEVSESYSSQTCSCCGSLSSSGRPRGIAGLGIREWTCSDCDSINDRDINAARNILRTGLCALVEGAARMRSSQKAEQDLPTLAGADNGGGRSGSLCF